MFVARTQYQNDLTLVVSPEMVAVGRGCQSENWSRAIEQRAGKKKHRLQMGENSQNWEPPEIKVRAKHKMVPLN